jgi:hypothetical protein
LHEKPKTTKRPLLWPSRLCYIRSGQWEKVICFQVLAVDESERRAAWRRAVPGIPEINHDDSPASRRPA